MTEHSKQAAVVGIDLGTTYSLVAHVDASGRPATVINSEGDLTTPSVVFFDRQGVIVGKEADKESWPAAGFLSGEHAPTAGTAAEDGCG